MLFQEVCNFSLLYATSDVLTFTLSGKASLFGRSIEPGKYPSVTLPLPAVSIGRFQVEFGAKEVRIRGGSGMKEGQGRQEERH